MDIANLAPEIAQLFGISPSTLVLLLFILVKGSSIVARLIPDDATGWKGAIRKGATIIGAHVSSRVTKGITVNDVARAALETPPIPAKVAEEAAARP